MYEWRITEHWFSQGYGSAQKERDDMLKDGYEFVSTIVKENEHFNVFRKPSAGLPIVVTNDIVSGESLKKLIDSLTFEQRNLGHVLKINGELRNRIDELQRK